MSRLEKAIAAAREALDNEAQTAEIDAVRLDGAIRELIAAIDAARDEAVAWRYRRLPSESWNSPEEFRGCLVGDGDEWQPLFAAPPAAVAVPANVTPMRQQRTDLARLVGSINAAVYANGDGLSVTEAIGALELAKLELLKEQEQ